MADTDKYELEEVAESTPGWNAILTTNMQKVDDNLHTYILITLGETVAAYQPLYQKPSDSKWYLAQADGTKQPARCFSIEAGDADDQIRGQRIGPLENDGVWNFAEGKNVWLSAATAGGVSQAQRGGVNKQCLGWAIVDDTIFIDIDRMENFANVTTTTTTTSTTSTSSSSSSTTTSTSSTTSSSSTTTTTTTA